jgi:hypothetical protein
MNLPAARLPGIIKLKTAFMIYLPFFPVSRNFHKKIPILDLNQRNERAGG